MASKNLIILSFFFFVTIQTFFFILWINLPFFLWWTHWVAFCILLLVHPYNNHNILHSIHLPLHNLQSTGGTPLTNLFHIPEPDLSLIQPYFLSFFLLPHPYLLPYHSLALFTRTSTSVVHSSSSPLPFYSWKVSATFLPLPLSQFEKKFNTI